MEQLLVPSLCTVEKVIQETPDIRTYRLKFKDEKLMSEFSWMPGQFVEFSLLGMVNVPSASPPQPPGRDISTVPSNRQGSSLPIFTSGIDEGDEVGIRGPYGNWFPLDDMKGKNLLFVGGGIGLAPLRSLIQYCIDNRNDYKDFTILYGARTSSDMCYKEEIEEWRKIPR